MSMTAEENQRLKRTLELTGLNPLQVEHILQDVRYIVNSAEYRLKTPPSEVLKNE